MRAVIFSTGDWPDLAPLNERYPAPLLPLMDRPFLQHVVEYLVHQGVTEFELIRCHLPEKIEEFLGDGKRWGCSFTYHLVRNPTRPYRLLHTMSWQGVTEPVLIGHGDCLPRLALAEARGTDVPSAMFTCQNGAGAPEWTGWALLTVEQIGKLPTDMDEAGFKAHLNELLPVEIRRLEVPRLLSYRTFNGILAGHATVLAKEFPGLLTTGSEADPGIWLSRNVVLHPTALLFPPVYICDNCEVGEGVKLGPNAVIANGCVLDRRSTVINSVIFSGSYIGEGLELSDVIVDKNHLINARMETAVKITDNFILGNLEEKHVRRGLVRLCSQGLGIVLLLLAVPVLLLTALMLKIGRRGPVLHRKEVVRLPARQDAGPLPIYRLWSFYSPAVAATLVTGPAPARWHGLFLGFLPGLVNVARGHLGFVGVPPRSRAEVKQLPKDWQQIYLAGKAGLVTEAAVLCGPAPTEDQLFAAETVYIASAGGKTDLKLLIGYLYRACLGFGIRPTVDKADDHSLTAR